MLVEPGNASKRIPGKGRFPERLPTLTTKPLTDLISSKHEYCQVEVFCKGVPPVTSKHKQKKLGGGLRDFLTPILLEEMIQFDELIGLKTP